MSFLLDALRKSEQVGRQRGAPTIHGDAPARPPQSPRGDDLLPVLAFVAPAFLLMCWFGLRMFEVGPLGPAEAPQSVSSVGKPTVQTVPPHPAEDSGGDAETPAEPQNVAPQFVGGGRPQGAGPRTPVEQVEQDPVRSGGGTGQPGGATSSQPPSGPATDPLAAASRAIEQAMASSDQPDQRPVRQPPAQAPAGQPTAQPPVPRQAAPERQNYVDYWELPDNVRNQLPEMKISVVVYAEQSEDRFILVNGQRLYEGDELQAGLELSEVRREGVIFQFRRYRFILAI